MPEIMVVVEAGNIETTTACNVLNVTCAICPDLSCFLG